MRQKKRKRKGKRLEEVRSYTASKARLRGWDSWGGGGHDLGATGRLRAGTESALVVGGPVRAGGERPETRQRSREREKPWEGQEGLRILVFGSRVPSQSLAASLLAGKMVQHRPRVVVHSIATRTSRQ